MTGQQWDCLLAASHGNAEVFHGKTRASLVKAGLIRWMAGQGLVPTIKGRNRLHDRFPAGRIGKVGADLSPEIWP